MRQRDGLGPWSGLHSRKIGNEWINQNERVRKVLRRRGLSINKKRVRTS